MIVAPKFDGDDWDELLWAQHDVYHDALAVIVRYCDNAYRMATQATKVADDPIADCLQAGYRLDHRTLQDAHDHLAAFWRRTGNHTHPDLKLHGDVEYLCSDWLRWLGSAVREWSFSHPNLVRKVCPVIVQQNVSLGYDAEDALIADLMVHYPLC